MFVFRDKIKEIDFGHGIKLTDLGGNGNMNVLHWNTPAGTVSPAHEHPEEQFGYLLKGSFEVTIGDEKAVLKAGDSYFIPGGVSHQFKLLEDCLAIDIFSPRRPVPEPAKS
ncbi:MAG TPA: cupin domain-containing protein [Candidatus Riflebacteria bacterium]|jgi:quercetin dioxygenase-like cupin family protein|nr:cupin domain-containing protein [Candidatus Riflebacteria bacterium]